MDVGQQVTPHDGRGERDRMIEAPLREPGVAGPAVGHDVAAQFRQLGYGIEEGDCRGVWDDVQPDAPDGGSSDLGSDQDQALARRATAPGPGLDAADEGFIHLDLARKKAPPGHDHSSAHAMQPSP